MYLRLSYQWIFEVHKSSLVQGKPAFFEAFCLLQRKVVRHCQAGGSMEHSTGKKNNSVVYLGH